MPGRCVKDADADVDVELGREIGSRVGGGRICGPSSMAGLNRDSVSPGLWLFFFKVESSR